MTRIKLTPAAAFAALIGLAFAGGLAVAMVGLALGGLVAAQTPGDGPTYTAKGELAFPTDYRRWVYLSSGYDMSYAAVRMGMSMFDNVFVDPAAYAQFQATGTWPDKTVLVLEPRGAQEVGSINKAGRFQTDRMGLEVHVKDSERFGGDWAFFTFDGDGAGKLVPHEAACYSCHAAHAAVDTTFVQFYPTLKPIAAAKGTFSASYLAEEAAAAKVGS